MRSAGEACGRGERSEAAVSPVSVGPHARGRRGPGPAGGSPRAGERGQ